MSHFSRKQIQAALICYAAFLLYATLWPFDFHFAQGFVAARKISWIPFFDPVEGPGRRDAVLNILVFLPFGALSFLGNSASEKMRWPLLVATLLGGALSFSIEVAQIGLPSRNPSTSDLLMNTTGTLFGALSARALQRMVRSDPEGFRLRIRRNAVPLAVIAYALALLASTMRTFDPILTWPPLYARARRFATSSMLPDHLDLDYAVWMIVSFGFLSFLVSDFFTGRSAIRQRSFGYVSAFVACSLFVVTLEAMQILFRSRQPLPSHAMLGILGVVYGMAWHGFLRPRAEKFPVLPFFSHYALLLFLAYLAPIPHSVGRFRFDIRGLIPLYFYLKDISLPSLYAAARAIVLYIPIGIVAQWTPGEIPNRGCWGLMILSIGIQTVIEICRGFSGYQYPDPSNIFLAVLGVYTGLHITIIINNRCKEEDFSAENFQDRGNKFPS